MASCVFNILRMALTVWLKEHCTIFAREDQFACNIIFIGLWKHLHDVYYWDIWKSKKITNEKNVNVYQFTSLMTNMVVKQS